MCAIAHAHMARVLARPHCGVLATPGPQGGLANRSHSLHPARGYTWQMRRVTQRDYKTKMSTELFIF